MLFVGLKKTKAFHVYAIYNIASTFVSLYSKNIYTGNEVLAARTLQHSEMLQPNKKTIESKTEWFFASRLD